MSTLTEYLSTTGETQVAFAARIGSTQGTISKLCSGKSPSLMLATKIEKATGGAVRAGDWLQIPGSELVHDEEHAPAGNILQGHVSEMVRSARPSVAERVSK